MAVIEMTDDDFLQMLQKAIAAHGSDAQRLADAINEFIRQHGYMPAAMVEKLVGNRSKGFTVPTREAALQGFTIS
jgi:hypothetical protein